jgi:hypothetical protein
MTKQGGMGDNLYVAGVDVSGDIGSLGRIGGGPAALEVTSITKSGYERIGGLRDGAMEFNSYFNPSAGQEHLLFRGLPTADVIATYARGTTLGNQAACLVAKQINYDGNRGDDGSFTFSVAAQANGYGIEWGRQLTAGKRSDTTATNGASIDTLASVSFGAQAYLQVFSFTGTSCTVTIQDSADDASFANLTGGGFTAATAITTQRIETGRTQAVRRYLRIATTGTFSQCTFSVVIVKNETSVTF